MYFETVNHIYGTSQNPWDPQRTTGGSSGGDAGLIAAGGALLAICGDLAGSIRIPAAFCGVYGFKPSSRRTPGLEVAQPHPECMTPLELVVKVAYGPIGRCVEDLVLVMETWWKQGMWTRDNLVVPMQFDTEEYRSGKKMRIGYFEDNLVFECAGVVKNSLREIRGKLECDGHLVVEIECGGMKKGVELFVKAMAAMEGSYFHECLQGEEPCWPYKQNYRRYQYPILNPLFNFLSKKSGYKMSDHLSSLEKSLSYKEFCQLMREITEYRLEFNKMWQGMELDAVICPIWPLVAPLHTATQQVSPGFSYAYLWNLLDFAAGVVPVKLVAEGENVYTSTVDDKYVVDAQKIMKDSIGMPVAIQVVASTYNDEKALRLMKIVQSYCNFHRTAVNFA